MRSGIYCVIMTMVAFCAPVMAYDWTTNPGDGTPENPYQISTPDQLMAIGDDANLLNKHFVLTQDIVFDPNNNPSHVFTEALIAPTAFNGFTGHFDGNDHCIRNLSINAGGLGTVGLFGVVGNQGEVNNLQLQNVHIIAGLYIGGLAGVNANGTIRSCSVSGTITCFGDRCGGLVGSNEGGNILACYAQVDITLSGYFSDEISGGFVGRNSGNIDQCAAASAILCLPSRKSDAVGGFVGYQSTPGSITNSCSYGMIHTDNEIIWSVGGFAGENYGAIAKCYTTVSQIHEQIQPNVGYDIDAFVGFSLTAYMDCFSDVGKSHIIYSNAIRLNTEQMQTAQPFIEAGWDFVGESANGSQDVWKLEEGDYPRLAWLPETTVPAVENSLLADAQAVLMSKGVAVGRVRYHYSDSIPAKTVTSQSIAPGQAVTFGREVDLWVSNGLPCPYSGGGDGSPQNPCRIGTYTDLVLLGQTPTDYDKCFVLINDIDMASSIPGQGVFPDAVIAWQASIGIEWYHGNGFQGRFDGNGHSISNLTIVGPESSDFVGLFGVTSQAEISNLNLINFSYASLTDQYGMYYAGGLTGRCVGGSISNCSVTGAISTFYRGYQLGGISGDSCFSSLKRCHAMINMDGKQSLGGLVGLNYGTIQTCSASGRIDGASNDSYFGGLIGDNHGDISGSWATGAVSGYNYVGGLIGQNAQGAVTSCYSLSSVTGNSVFVGCLIGLNGTRDSNFQAVSNADPITNCYATGPANTSFAQGLIGYGYEPVNVINSYWDLNAGGMDTQTYGTGLTTEQMKQQASFVGWDFLGESANGENEIWRMCVDGVDYPRLSWEFAEKGDFACGDGVDLADLQALANHWLASITIEPDTFNTAVDANGDGQIDLADFDILSENWPSPVPIVE